MSDLQDFLATSPEDAIILAMAMSLGRQLGIPKLKIEEIRWANAFRYRALMAEDKTTVRVPSDWCLFRHQIMYMPRRVQGVLTLDEWQPLIASSILYEKKIGNSVHRSWNLIGLFLFLLPFAGLFALGILLGTVLPFLLYLVVVFPEGLIVSRIYTPHVKRARLEADTQASVITGKKYFLDALRKIDGKGLEDVERLKAGKVRRWTAPPTEALPSITERIENLLGYQSAISSTSE